MVMQNVGIGIIGTGFGKIVTLPGFLSVPKAKVIGIIGRDPKKSQQLAKEFSLPRHFAHWQELVDCPDVNAIAIVGPNELHKEMALRAFEKGKAVLCEKPLALNLNEATQLAAAAKKSGQVHMVDFLFRENAAMQEGQRMLRAAALGKPLYATVEFTTSSGPPNLSWTWRSDRNGGGILAILGVHSLDYISWMLGPVSAASAYAGTRVAARKDDATGAMKPVTSEDCVQAVLETANGTPVSLVVSSLASAGRRHFIEVVCEKGTLRIVNEDARDHNKFDLWIAKPGQEFERATLKQSPPLPGDTRIAMFRSLAERFVNAVAEKKRDVEPSFEDGYRAQQLMEMLLISHRERRWVTQEDLMS